MTSAERIARTVAIGIWFLLMILATIISCLRR
jgi:hypothetical protein